MRIRDLCTKRVVTISPDASVLDAARLMREHHVGDVVVTTRTGDLEKPLGLLTDRDLVVRVLAEGFETLSKLQMQDLLVGAAITAPIDSDLDDVLQRMRDKGIRRMPLVGAQGELLAIVAYDDLVEAIAERVRDLAEVLINERVNEQKHRKPRRARPDDEWR